MRWGFLFPSFLPAEPQVDKRLHSTEGTRVGWPLPTSAALSLGFSNFPLSLSLQARLSIIASPRVLHHPLLVFLNPAVNSSFIKLSSISL